MQPDTVSGEDPPRTAGQGAARECELFVELDDAAVTAPDAEPTTIAAAATIAPVGRQCDLAPLVGALMAPAAWS